jgi:hypothetical protein
MNRIFSLVVITFVALLTVVSIAAAGVPSMMQYQGFLTNDSGEPLDTMVDMTFTIYDASTGSGIIWTETQDTVRVNSGLFYVLLGSVNTIVDTVFAETERWLGITVDPDPEIVPRTKLITVPYAFRAATVDGARGGNIQGNVQLGGKLNVSRPEDADLVVFETGGTERFSITAHASGPDYLSIRSKFENPDDDIIVFRGDGRVGVGTASPSAKLQAVTNVPGMAVHGENTSSENFGYLAGDSYGVYGQNDTDTSSHFGYLGSTEYGVYGEDSVYGTFGYLGGGTVGAAGYFGEGYSGNFGLLGYHSAGVYAWSQHGDAVYAYTDSGTAVYAVSLHGPAGHFVGNVGIGEADPDVPLHVTGGTDVDTAAGGYFVIGNVSSTNIGMDNNEILARNNGGTANLMINRDGGDVWMCIDGGDVGIGTSTPGYKLDVNGDINVSGSYNVKKGGVNYTHPDYVFEPDYELMSLDELREYVFENKSLPNVVSAEDVKKNDGFKMDQLLIQMLEKIEEQTLYILQLEERIEELEKAK